jgi:hypothetical protein
MRRVACSSSRSQNFSAMIQCIRFSVGGGNNSSSSSPGNTQPTSQASPLKLRGATFPLKSNPAIFDTAIEERKQASTANSSSNVVGDPSGAKESDKQPSPFFADKTDQEITAILDGPLRPSGLWKVDEVLDSDRQTVDFRRIDDIETEISEDIANADNALVLLEDEEKWKNKLMFEYKFKRTPKHLTWREFGQEIDCFDCVIEPDKHRPEEIFSIKFQFIDRKLGRRDLVWEARNDINLSQGLTDFLAAIGSCLGRSEVFRTIRFDDGAGTLRDVTIRKRSKFTSDITMVFKPAETYNVYERQEQNDAWEEQMEKDGMSTWGFHPALMDPEYQDQKDPPESYTIAITAHALSFILLRCLERLVTRPLSDFYRPSQIVRTAKMKGKDHIGLSHAMKGWLGMEEKIYQHFTPIEAIQENWLGPDSPFSLIVIMNKLREMTNLKKKNPEFQSWLSVRHRDTSVAMRNVAVKLLGAGASTLFVPVGHNATVNRLLPKSQQRRLESSLSVNAVLGMPDETRNIAEFKKITGHERITSGEHGSQQRGQITGGDKGMAVTEGPEYSSELPSARDNLKRDQK